ncbi:MAG: CotH kinase family protein [Clostridia bacterium]|nr:CotH kinase family protein [Clostridia bacterium]
MKPSRLPLLILALGLIVLLAAPALAEGAVEISEVMASNGTWSGGHAYDWVELHNVSGKTLDLSGWTLSDSAKRPDKFVFPGGTALKKDAHLLVYCTGDAGLDAGKGSVFYAPFKLSASGDDVFLFDAAGEKAAEISFGPQYGNISWGVPAGGGQAGYFASATPGKKNGKTVCASRCDTPAILTAGGLYAKEVTVQASCAAGDTLRYTLDGSAPTEKSKKFPASGLTVKKTAPLRVAAFREGAVPSAPASATYLIGEAFPVAVVCLTTDPDYMFSKKSGALVKGTGAVPNYDKPYEYPVNIEYFDEEGVCRINQMGSFTASGHSARQNPQKSIALHARKAYGPAYFDYNPFPHRDYTRYHSLLLRSTNSDAFSERLRDVVFSSLAEDLGVCYQDARPIVVFINGEYWGHYNLREKINKYMVAQWEGIDLADEDTVDAIDLLSRTGSDKFVQNGSNADWLALCDFCKTKDLNNPENLRWVTDRIDVDNLFTHAAYQIISGNTDITNVRVYRVPGGKWKYLLFDVEASFGSGSDSDTTPLNNYIKPVSARFAAFRHEPLNALLAVPEMRDRFLRRFAEVLETSFRWPFVESKFAYMEGVLEQLLPRHIKRWGSPKMTNWRKNVNATKYYARVRPKKVVAWLQKRMGLSDAEVETYFGEIRRILEKENTK